MVKCSSLRHGVRQRHVPERRFHSYPQFTTRLHCPHNFQMLNNRLRRRLFHHILIAVGSVALTVIFMHFFPKRDFISRASIGTAYPALFLTAAALLLRSEEHTS